MQAKQPMLLQLDGQDSQGVSSRDRPGQAGFTTAKLLLQQASTTDVDLKQLLTAF